LGGYGCELGGHREFVEQILIRAKNDGIAMYQLDRELKTKHYFQSEWKRRKMVNLFAVARALDFFGATLVIDWRDR